MSRKFSEMTIRPADMVLVAVALVLAVLVGYQVGLNKNEAKLISVQNASQDSAESVLTANEEDKKIVDLVNEEEEKLLEMTKEAVGVQSDIASDEPSTTAVEGTLSQPASISISASAIDNGGSVSVSAELGGEFSGTCVIRFAKIGYEERIRKDAIVNFSTSCGVDIPKDEFGLVGEWEYGVSFMSDDKLVEGNSGAGSVVVN